MAYVINNPIEITPSIFISSSIAEPDVSRGEVMWSPTGNYTLGFEVFSPSNHRMYKNTLAGISATPPEFEPSRWEESDVVSNKWAAVDLVRNTQSESTDDIVMQFLLPTGIDSLGLTGLVGEKVEVSLNNGVSDIYNYSQALFNRKAASFYEWHFGKFTQIRNIVRIDLPPVSNCTLTITIRKTGNMAKTSGVVVGSREYLGKLQYASTNKGINFTRIQRDTVVAKVVPRYSRPVVTAKLFVDNGRLNALQQLRVDLSNKVTIWTGIDDDNIQQYFDLYLVNGLWQTFDVTQLSPNESVLDLQIEEL